MGVFVSSMASVYSTTGAQVMCCKFTGVFDRSSNPRLFPFSTAIELKSIGISCMLSLSTTVSDRTDPSRSFAS